MSRFDHITALYSWPVTQMKQPSVDWLFGQGIKTPEELKCVKSYTETSRDDRWFESRQGLGIFLFTTASRTALVSTQPPIQWVPGALSLGVKRPRREADQSPPSSAEVKECVEIFPPLLQYTFMAWCSVKTQGQFHFYQGHIPEGSFCTVTIYCEAYRDIYVMGRIRSGADERLGKPKTTGHKNWPPPPIRHKKHDKGGWVGWIWK
jgi:hypothetical protein